jgi:hypothetical protein
MWRCASLAAVAVTLALASCNRANSPVAQQPAITPAQLRDAARSIVLCQTADSTLLRRLGRPSRDGLLHHERVMSWIAPNESLTLFLAVALDSAGTVVDLYWDIPTEVPWVPTSQCPPSEPTRRR